MGFAASLSLTAADLLDPDLEERNKFVEYRFEVEDYVRDLLGRPLWGDAETGQVQIARAYELALRQMHERKAFEDGRLAEEELEYWTPGQTIKNWIAVDAGHNVGKTRLLAALTSHFFDCFPPAVGYAFAPTDDQINDLLFKEIRVDRNGKSDLPGQVMLEPRIKYKADHFVKGKATANSSDAGIERVHGQHGRYMIFVIDEAEGVQDYVFNSIESMASGGIVIVLVSRNPRTRKSRAHKIRSRPATAKFRLSCFDFPNVVLGRDEIPGGVRREYIEAMLDYCEPVEQHDDDAQTFVIPWQNDGQIYRPGVEFLWRVLGFPAMLTSDNTFVPIGRYEAATKRKPIEIGKSFAAIGVDAARYGSDAGTIWVAHNGRLWRAARVPAEDSYQYYLAIVAVCKLLDRWGVTDVSVRVDGGGGYGSGAIDFLNNSHDPKTWFDAFDVHEVYFNGRPYDVTLFGDKVTELYYWAGEGLKIWALEDPPGELEADLCERVYRYNRRVVEVMLPDGRLERRGVDVKILESKDNFRKREGRSPDDGDGVALALAPEYVVAEVVKVSRQRRPGVMSWHDKLRQVR